MRRTLRSAPCNSRRREGGCPHSIRRMLGSAGWLKVQPPSCGTRRKGAMSDPDLDELASELSEFAAPEAKSGRPPRDERIIAGFEEIQRFYEKHSRSPQHGEERDIFERL